MNNLNHRGWVTGDIFHTLKPTCSAESPGERPAYPGRRSMPANIGGPSHQSPTIWTKPELAPGDVLRMMRIHPKGPALPERPERRAATPRGRIRAFSHSSRFPVETSTSRRRGASAMGGQAHSRCRRAAAQPTAHARRGARRRPPSQAASTPRGNAAAAGARAALRRGPADGTGHGPGCAQDSRPA